MKPKLILDQVHGNIEFSMLETRFMRSPLVNRLHYVLQNSTTYLTYPSCKTARFEHSLGVMDNVSRIFINGLNNAAVSKSKSLVDEFLDEKFNTLIVDDPINTKYKDSISNAEFLESLEDLIGREFLTRNFSINNYDPTLPHRRVMLLLIYEALRIYGLFHDIGHLPTSHVFEFAISDFMYELNEQIRKDKRERDANNTKLLNDVKALHNEKDQIHELIGKRISSFIFRSVRKKLNNPLQRDGLALIQVIWRELIRGSEGNLYSISSIVDSDLDGDRMDYIVRDGRMSGLIKDVGNIDRIIKLFCLCKRKEKSKNIIDDFVFLPSIQSIHAIEETIRARFNEYKYMVNHHAVKRSDTVLRKAIVKTMFWELDNKLKRLDNKSYDVTTDHEKKPHYIGSTQTGLLESLELILRAIELKGEPAYDTHRRIEAELPLITDYWLISYFSTIYLSGATDSQDDDGISLSLNSLLGEIHRNERKVKSLWKRTHEYHDFLIKLEDKGSFKVLRVKSEFTKLVKRRLEREKELGLDDDDSLKLKNTPEYDILHRLITYGTYEGCGLDIIKFLNFRPDRTKHFRNIEEAVAKGNIRMRSGNVRILLAATNNSVGIKDSFVLTNIRDNKVRINFEEASVLKESLLQEEKISIQFFTYFCLIGKSGEIINIDTNENKLRKQIVAALLDAIWDEYFKQWSKRIRALEIRVKMDIM